MGFVSQESARQICTDSLGRKYPAALEGNLKGLDRGFDQVRQLSKAEIALYKSRIQDEKEKDSTGAAQEWGYVTAPAGGVNPRFGSTVTADLSPSRQGYIPVFIKERCINCGLCDSTCPDMVFQFAKGEIKVREIEWLWYPYIPYGKITVVQGDAGVELI